ncbi:hypothetical protein K3495_g919 [Podosphaera aphanis]|nr:hypothetical protein K3495_g919 [Podosphaera aphanis]
MKDPDGSPRFRQDGAWSHGTHDESDSEYQHALEVIFDEKNAHRRRSSLVATDLPELMSSRRISTECYIHALLESYRRSANSSLDKGIDGSFKQSRPESKGYDGNSINDPSLFSSGSINRKKSGSCKDETLPGENPCRKDSQGWDSQKTDILVPVFDERKVLHSRLLSKKQLSEMAWGVRELSKRLGSIRLKLNVKTVFLLTKAHDESLVQNTREVAKWLLSPERQVRYTVWVEENMKDNHKFDASGLLEELRVCYDNQQEHGGKSPNLEKRLRYWNFDMCKLRPHTFDFVVTLGGDGTVLYASWLFQRIVPPVLSFSLGSLGFLTKFDYESFPSTLTNAFKDGVTIRLRLRFEGTIMRSVRKIKVGSSTEGNVSFSKVEDQNNARDLVEELVKEEREDEMTHRPDSSHEILNDIVVDRGPNPTMSSIELFSDNQHLTSVSADGICVATPTGSTAYNLAAGGSLCHPDNPVILVTAICAHTLSFRPIILPDTMVLRVGVPYDARTSSWASFDGRERVELRPGDYITISASRYPFASVMHPELNSEDWIGSISDKLGWNTRQRQKTFQEWST